ncbi:MAG: sigma-54 dependent transcriptional regulator [Candidatus Eisenbacteria bacterium]
MARPRPLVLVVERDGDGARSLAEFLRRHDLDVVVAHDGEAAGNALDKRRVNALLCALRAPRIEGLALLAHALARRPGLCAILFAESDDVERAAEAVRRGAWDVRAYPLQLDRLLATLRRGLEHQELVERVERMAGELDRRRGVDALVGGSRAIERVREQVRQIAPTRSSVLLVGEAGTGRSVVARAIHHASPRRDERFVWLDVAAASPDTIESELFGEPADGDRPARAGRIELADRGTLYVDHVELLPERAQLRLLRVLQDRVLDRPGGAPALRVDVRMLAATSVELGDEVRAGRFREDLYYRLDVVRIALPALRDRREDIPLLAEHLLRQIAREHGRRPRRITRGALDRLRRYAWPGNVSELVRALEAMVVSFKGRGPLDVSALPDMLRAADEPAGRLELAVGMTLAEAERQLVEATLRHTGGNKARAAAMLGVGLRTLYRMLDRHRLA